MDYDQSQNVPKRVEDPPLDEILGKDLAQRLQSSEDAARYHQSEHQRHVAIVKACSAALSILQPDRDTPASAYEGMPVQGQGGIDG